MKWLVGASELLAIYAAAMSETRTTNDAATAGVAADQPVVIDHERLADFIAEIFRHTACSDAESERIGRSLVGANLSGHDSHGVIRSALYVELLANGVQLADQEIKVLIDSGSLMLLDRGA